MTDNKEALGTSQDAQATSEPTRLLLLGKRLTRKPLQSTTISWLKCCMR